MIHTLRSLSVLVLLSVGASLASAQDLESAKAVLVELEAAVKAKDEAGVSAAAGKVPAQFNGIEDKAMRGKLAGGLAKALKSKHVAGAHADVLAAVFALGDPKLAWKSVSKFMPNAKKTEEATEFQIAVVSGVGALAQKSAIAPLLELVSKAKDNKLAAAAAVSLGGYKDDVKNRVKIYVELVDIGLRIRPGRSTSKTVSPEAQARWMDVGAGIITALNTLTGRSEKDFEAHEELYKANKKKPKAIFPDE